MNTNELGQLSSFYSIARYSRLIHDIPRPCSSTTRTGLTPHPGLPYPHDLTVTRTSSQIPGQPAAHHHPRAPAGREPGDLMLFLACRSGHRTGHGSVLFFPILVFQVSKEIVQPFPSSRPGVQPCDAGQSVGPIQLEFSV